VLDINNRQKLRIAEIVAAKESPGCKLALFGFSYKKNTSDTRSTPVASVVAHLIAKGFRVSVHDPEVSAFGFEAEMELQAKRNFFNSPEMEFCGKDVDKCVNGAHAILVMTEWDCFRTYDYRQIVDQMSGKTIYDFRCYMDQEFLRSGSCFDRAFQLGVGWLTPSI
jgi:UDPglucose 6-dehydrogenase